MIKRIDRIGEQRLNQQGYLMTLVEYIGSRNIIVEFNDLKKHRVKTEWELFDSGKTICWDLPTVEGKGIVGSEWHKIPRITTSKEYTTWYSMIRRCYNEEIQLKRPRYKNCIVCDEWLYFDNFYKWIHEQSNCNIWINSVRSAIDKDILFKGNKIYSPQTCCLVPYKVNALFVKNDSKRGNLPIGVRFHKAINKFTAQYSDPFDNFRIHYIGHFETPTDAFNAYKIKKEKVIKNVALEEYRKGTITEKCYNAMKNYKVEIND